MRNPHRFVAVVLLALAGSSVVWAADSFRKPLGPALQAVVDAAKEKGLTQIAIVCREDVKGDREPQLQELLQTLAADLKQMLGDAQLTVIATPELAKFASQKASQAFSPDDFEKVAKLAACDAVLAADFKRTGKARGVRLALVSQNERLLIRNVGLGTDSSASSTSGSTKSSTTGKTSGSGTRFSSKGSTATGSASAGGAVAGSVGSAVTSGLFPFGVAGAVGTSTGLAGAGGTSTGTTTDTGDKPDPSKNSKDLPPLNRDVLNFAVEKIGEQVGNGECWTLALEALQAAGAAPPRGNDFGADVALKDILPGDILQFTSARFEDANSYAILGTPGHTAIVYAVSGRKVLLLHQNFGKKVVTTLDINFDNMVQGTVEAYRPSSKN